MFLCTKVGYNIQRVLMNIEHYFCECVEIMCFIIAVRESKADKREEMKKIK